MEKMNHDSDGRFVNVLQVIQDGEFIATPIAGQRGSDSYDIFLADFNNYMNEITQNGKLFSSQNFKIGEVVGVYCKIQASDHDKLWYRGRVLIKFSKVNGITSKVLLVDHNATVLVPGIHMARFDAKYQDFPYQMMKCNFYGLKPLSYKSTPDSLVSQQISKHWDSSTKTRLQEFTQGCLCRLHVCDIDKEGVFHVTLYKLEFDAVGRQQETNINELLVKEKYAVFEDPGQGKQFPQNGSDDAASTISGDMSVNSDNESTKMSQKELERMLERKRIAMKRFNLGIDSALDEYREAFGRPPPATVEDKADSPLGGTNGMSAPENGMAQQKHPSSLSHTKSLDKGGAKKTPRMVPANCSDGVNIDDDSSHVDDMFLAVNRSAESRRLLDTLLGKQRIEDEPPGLQEIQPEDKEDAPMLKLGKKDEKSVRPVPNGKSTGEGGATKGSLIWSRIKAQDGDADISSLTDTDTDNEREKRRSRSRDNAGYTSDSSYASAERILETLSQDRDVSSKHGSTPFKAIRYENECHKQHFKNKGDDNSFRISADSLDLLKALGGSSAAKVAETLPRSFEDVLVSGDSRPKCSLSFEELGIPSWLRFSLRDKETKTVFTKPTVLQSYVWPATMRGRHVVGIDRAKSGKTLGYLVPILKQVIETPLIYKNLPKETGPIVLILTTDWNEARNIHSTCEKIVYTHRKNYRAKILYGGRGKMEEEMVDLINGCEILVATIPSLLNMLEKHCTSLVRLCHLVFDDVNVLVEMFAEEIKVLMRQYADSLSKTVALNLPHQLVAMGTEWSRGVESLVNAYFDNPLMIIPNMMEASVFKQVKQHVEICPANQRIDHLVSFLQNNGADEKSVIFANSAKEVDSLAKLLESQCIAVIKATEFMSPTSLMDAEASWNFIVQSGETKNTVLAMTDRGAARMSVRNATCLINYEFPTKKSDFANRLACLLGAMKEKNENMPEQCKASSLILITEQNEFCTPSVVKFLTRARQPVPVTLNSIAESTTQHKEKRAKICCICDDLKFFGKCRDLQKCQQRHTIFADSDEPKNIPKRGVVKVKILDVVHANVYWGKIMEHRLPVGADEREKYDTKAYFKLACDMQIYYAMKQNRKRHGTSPEGVLVDDLCVIEAEEIYKRVRVRSVVRRSAQTGIATEVNVFGIDCALSKDVPVEELLFLPSNKHFSLEEVPAQAIELVVSGVKPVDSSFSWTIEACLKVNKLICGKTLEGKIALGLRNTLWLDPLVEKTKYDSLNANVAKLHVGAALIEFGFAEKNRAHVSNLRELCKDSLPSVANATMESERPSKPVTSDSADLEHDHVELPDSGYQDVYVAAVDNPGLLFVQLSQNVDRLDKLEDKIEAVMNVLPKHEEPDIKSLGRGSVCLAKFTIDDKWYRARVLEINEDNEYHVFYVDHGDREWIPSSRLWKAWPEILELPFQAVECSLVQISPKGSEWTTEDGDCLWDLCQNKLLVAQVKSEFPSKFAGDTRYEIELHDTTGEVTINMSHELVLLGRAQGSQDCIQEIFPDALWCSEDRQWENEVECLPDICLQIYLSEAVPEQLKRTRELQRILNDFKGETSLLNSGVKSMLRLLAMTKEPEIKTLLIDSLLMMIRKDERLCLEIRRVGGLQIICSMLSEEPVAEKTITVLKFYATDKRDQDLINQYGGLKAICNVLKENPCNEVAVVALECLCALCEENDQNCQQCFEHGVLGTLISFLQTPKEGTNLDQCTYALSVLAKCSKVRENLLQQGVLDVLGDLLTKTLNRKCLLNVLETMRTAVNNNQMVREHLRKSKIRLKIER
ncbi:putative ATP-dependent RNA helicase TDRD12 [Rhopilema esculentum]|uniref:putative ATP-dependent RNA helicase TDRD12 n=1 Tax=Rhopilema esculentum TaxID=499914 RepID=UPI0031CEBC3D